MDVGGAWQGLGKRSIEKDQALEPNKKQNSGQRGVPTEAGPNQGPVDDCHDHVEALSAIINGASESGGSGINQGQEMEVDGLSGLMSKGSSLRPNGAVSAPPAPNVEMRQISPLIDEWFNGFGSLSNGLSVTLKKALVENSKHEYMSPLTTGKLDETLRAIWNNREFYTKMINKIRELKQSHQQFDDSLALGLLFHMIAYAHTIEFSALTIDDLKFQCDQGSSESISFGFFPSLGNNSCILSAVRNDSCVFVGRPGWRIVTQSNIVNISEGGTILTPNGDVMCVSKINYKNTAHTFLYGGVVYKKNDNLWIGTVKLPVSKTLPGGDIVKLPNPIFVPAGDKTIVQERQTTDIGKTNFYYYEGQFIQGAGLFKGSGYCSEGTDEYLLKCIGNMKRCLGNRNSYIYEPFGRGTVYFTKDISVTGHWKDGELQNEEHTIRVNPNSLRGNFKGLRFKFEGNKMVGITYPILDISKRNLANFLLNNNCIEMTDTVRNDLQQIVNHGAPASAPHGAAGSAAVVAAQGRPGAAPPRPAAAPAVSAAAPRPAAAPAVSAAAPRPAAAPAVSAAAARPAAAPAISAAAARPAAAPAISAAAPRPAAAPAISAAAARPAAAPAISAAAAGPAAAPAPAAWTGIPAPAAWTGIPAAPRPAAAPAVSVAAARPAAAPAISVAAARPAAAPAISAAAARPAAAPAPAASGSASARVQMPAQISDQQLFKEFARLYLTITQTDSNSSDLNPLKEMVNLYNTYCSEFQRQPRLNYVYHILLYKHLLNFSLRVKNPINKMDISVLSNIDYFNNLGITGTRERISNLEFLDYIVGSDFRDRIADHCKGKEILKTLEELKQKVERQELTDLDRKYFRALNSEVFRSFLTNNNSQGANGPPFVQQLNDELCDVEQLIKQYDSVPHVSKQNPVCQGDFVAPDKINKKCSAKIFKLLQDKGYITDQRFVFTCNYLKELAEAFSGSDLSQYLDDIKLFVAQNLRKNCTLTTESFVKEGCPNTKEAQIIFDELRQCNILDENGKVVLKDGQTVDQLDLSVLTSEVNHHENHVRGVLRKSAEGSIIVGD